MSSKGLQEPASQEAMRLHSCPQVPQFFKLVFRFTHFPSQQVAVSPEQIVPQAPQFPGLADRFTQVLLQRVPPERKQAFDPAGLNPIPVTARVIGEGGVVVIPVAGVVVRRGVDTCAVGVDAAGTVMAVVGKLVLPASRRTQWLFSGTKPSLHEHWPC
jgi:hypothetical protein